MTTTTKRSWQIENSQGCILTTIKSTTARGAYRIFCKTWSVPSGDYVNLSAEMVGAKNGSREGVRITAR